jgi:hypothetical protein
MNATDIFGKVWRFDFSAPGFCFVDLGIDVDSHRLRSDMATLKSQLSEILSRTGKRFVYRSLGRFDQQVTTKFHLDGAPPEALLMLGYEPSKVRSRLFLADYTRCACDCGLTPEQFMNDLNPMFHPGDEALTGYVTEVPPLEDRASRIVLINNSSLPFTNARTNALGVMHKAEILNPIESERRIVNSIMLTTADSSAPDKVGDEQEFAFVTTDKISTSNYGRIAE